MPPALVTPAPLPNTKSARQNPLAPSRPSQCTIVHFAIPRFRMYNGRIRTGVPRPMPQDPFFRYVGDLAENQGRTGHRAE